MIQNRWKCFRKIVTGVLSLSLVMGTMTGCIHPGGIDGPRYDKFLTITVFDTLANYEGLQSGWFAKIVKDKFNMELNIIAPNVSDDGDSIYRDRFAAGNLGDLLIVGNSSRQLQDLVDAGLVTDMSSVVYESGMYQTYQKAIDNLNKDIQSNIPGGIYGIPTSISSAGALTPTEVEKPNYGMYMRYDLYRELGSPVIQTLEDCLPVLKQMQELCPKSDSGKQTYAFSFFNDWDGNMATFAKQPACFYGYDEFDFVLMNSEGTDFQNILDKDSLYYRSLHFFFEANQMGLVDPESPTLNYADVYSKTRDGQILSSPWPWLGQSAYNTDEHYLQDRAIEFIPIEDEKIACSGSNEYGATNVVVCVGSQAEDKTRLMHFIDWLYSPEGISASCAQRTQATAGPEGLTWEMTDNGPILTEFGKKALFGAGDIEVPEEWGSGTWSGGVCQLNFTPVSQTEKDQNGYPYYYEQWDSILQMQQPPIEELWAEEFGCSTIMDYINEHHQISVKPATSIIKEKETTELDAIRMQCARIITKYSWQLVFAEDEEAFENLFDEMVSRAYDSGYATIYDFDLKCAKVEGAARQRVIAAE